MTWPLMRYRILYEVEVEATNSALAEHEAIRVMENDPLRLRRVRITSLGLVKPTQEHPQT